MRGLDMLAVLFLLALAALAAVAGTALVDAGYFTPAGLALLVLIGVAFAGFATVHAHHQGPHNAQVHGAARPANEQEAVDAARGKAATPKLDHQHQFDN